MDFNESRRTRLDFEEDFLVEASEARSALEELFLILLSPFSAGLTCLGTEPRRYDNTFYVNFTLNMFEIHASN